MGYSSRQHLLLISLSCFLILSSTQVRFMAEGSRTLFKLLEEPLPISPQPHVMKGIEEKKSMIKERVMIGSHPPRCQMKCNTCRHCEAVQVPAVPQSSNQGKKISTMSTTSINSKISTAMRGDDNTNYKPMSWKCKCGDVIFNP
ncbi:hypothetical protein MKW92_002414 [Papaver armeniacum]|nr:hypothetical protein MKW92_002414 [Papaver armeniacum]